MTTAVASDNGVDWLEIPLPVGATWGDLAHGNSLFVLVPDGVGPTGAVSPGPLGYDAAAKFRVPLLVHPEPLKWYLKT